jgi:putative DNA primase/helicase
MKKMNKLDSAPIRWAAKGRWISILGALCPELETHLAKPGRHGACPVHGGQDGFRLFRDVEVSGGGICNSCGARPDGFALLMWLRGWDFPTALAAVAQTLDGVSMTTSLPARPRVPSTGVYRPILSDDRIRKLLRDTWNAGSPWNAPESSLLRTYLRNRGLTPEVFRGPLPLRFHPSLSYREEGTCLGRYPAMLALMSSADGQPATIHRTFLTLDGQKAPVPSPKKLMPHASGRPLVGGVVRLGWSGSCVGIAEGIETALAVRQAIGMTIWAALSCTFLERFQPPYGTEHVVIWSDWDKNGAGQRAAEALKDRLESSGIKVLVLLPPEIGMDWLDVLNRWGFKGFPILPDPLALAA